MRKNMDVGKRILGLLLTVCLVMGLIPPMPAKADDAVTVALYTDQSCQVPVQSSTYTYNGTQFKPYVLVQKDGQSVDSSEYQVIYGENTNAGTGTVNVIGASWSCNEEFTINKAQITFVSTSFRLTESSGTPYCFYTGAPVTPEITGVTGIRRDTGATVTLALNTDYTVTYGNNTNVCEDEDDISAPYLEIKFTENGNYKYATGTSTSHIPFLIYYNMEDVNIGDIANITYTGKAQTPSLTVTNTKNNNATVTYLTRWENNTNAGTATVTLSGTGTYKGSISKSFTISPANIGTATIKFDRDPANYDYTGSKIQIGDYLEVYLDDFKVPATNYTVDSIGSGALGQTQAVLTGTGNLTGTTTAPYTIVNTIASCLINKKELEYTGTENVPTVTVLDGSGRTINASDYTVTYYKEPTAGGTPYEAADKIDSPQDVGRYYIRIEGNSASSCLGSLGTVDEPLYFNIVPKQIGDLEYTINGIYLNGETELRVPYTGLSKWNEIQKVVVSDNGRELTTSEFGIKIYSDEACTTEVENASQCVNAGTYYIKVTGKGPYEGSECILRYVIRPLTATGTITVNPQSYTGNAVTPAKDDITVTVIPSGSSTPVSVPADGYEITSCSNNIQIGTANITIKLTGNYSGEVTGTFVIEARKISDCTVTMTPESVVYTGEAQAPVITVMDGVRRLTEGLEYQVRFYNNVLCRPTDEVTGQTNVGGCYVLVSGLGAYANANGDVKKIFTVTAKSLASSDITFTAAKQEYTGSPVEPQLTVMDGDKLLVKDTDYEVVGYYTDETCTTVSTRVSGRVFVKIKGKGNYAQDTNRVADFYIGNDVSVLVDSIRVPGSLTYDRASQYQKIVDNLQVFDMAGEVIEKSNYKVHFYSDQAHTNEVTSADHALFKNAGVIYIGIEGQNGYYGYFYGICSIAPRNISTLNASVKGTYTYSGSEIRPAINDGTDSTTSDGVYLVYQNAADGSDYTLGKSDYRITEYKDNKNAGTATITLTGQGNYTGSQTVIFNIQKKSLNDLTNLNVSVRGATYTSRKQLPSVTVTFGDDSTAMVVDTDITLEYFKDASYSVPATDADLTNAGEVYVKITGVGNYKDTLNSANLGDKNKYVISPRDIRETVVSLEGETYVYSGVLTASKIPEFTVRYQYSPGSYFTLEAGTDYTFTPETMAYKIGAQTLDIKAISGGNFTGDKAVTYYYRGNMDNSADEITVNGITDSVPYTINIGQIGATFDNISVWSKKTGQEIDKSCYTITYLNNKNVGTATVRITGKEEKYWTGTFVQTFKITGSISEAEVVLPDQVYTGNAYTSDTIQDIQVTCHGYTLVKDKDYTIESIDNGTNAALATAGASAPTITIKGKGDFFPSTTDTKKINFSIKYDINNENLEIAEIPNQTYTGSPIEPVVTVTYSKPDGNIVNLTRDVDFTVAYYNNTEVASANGVRGPYAVITAKEDGLLLSGSRTVPFSIGQVDLEDPARGYEITGVDSEYHYTGAAIRPVVTVQDSAGNILDPKNYSVVCESASWEANTEVTIKVNGKGNYYGTLTTTFRIVSRSLDNVDDQVEAVISDVTYNGTAQTPSFKIVFEDYNLDANGNGKTQTLRENVDYIIVGYYNNKDAGEAGNEYNYESGPYVKIQAVPGRSVVGERVIPFTIHQKDMEDLYYSKVENPTYESGKTIYEPPVTVKIASDSAEELLADNDYTINYYNNTQAAAANNTVGPYIEIKAYSRNFTGSHIIPFSILAKDITGEEFQVELRETSGGIFDEKKWNYPNPGTYTPQVILTDCTDPENPIELQSGIDYQLSYANNNAVGTATITITARNNYTGTRVVKFTIGTLFDASNISVNQGNSPVTDSFESVVYNGKVQTPADVTVKRIIEPVAELVEGTDYAIRYYSDEACERPVPADNVINAGTYYVKLTGLAAGGYIGDIVIPYTIKQKSLNSSDVIIDEIPDQYYGGGNVRPAIRMTDEGTGLEIPTSNYDVTYQNNMSIGTATAVITANENGNYTRTREITFNILRQDINGATVSKIPDYDYTGSAILPDPVVYFNGTRLVKGKDYVLQNNPNYGNNVKAGVAWVVIQGIGNYTGVKADATFRIKANLEKATVSTVSNQIYTGKEVKPSVSVMCGGNVLTAGKEYQITYGNNVLPGDAYMILTPTEEYSGLYTGSYVLRFSICDNIENADITIPTSQTYTKSKITPEPVVKIGSTLLKKNVDYTVQWNNAVNVGKATVVVTGMGKYAGTKSKTYNIIAKNINRCSVNKIANVSYNKKSHSPSVVVRDGTKVLAKNIDYTVSYSNNTKIGTAVITIKGIGNYSGTKKVKFSIVSAPITGLRTSSVTNTSVKLSWTKKSNITGYQVYTNNARTRIAQSKNTSVTIKNLKAGTTYKYKVRTYTVIGKKTYYGAFKTITFATKPTTPTITVSSSTKGRAKISWKRISGATGYEVYAATSQKGSYKRIAMILKGTTVSYTNKSLRSGRTYYYKVRAYRTVNGKKVYSSYSKVKSVVVK